eukprot:CAMPEP_0197913074 /NCGR_PEP_ID=MMETSP1439-20131203/75998_1 /TAXON_ID=66791 /ORGANISM="Gonyaulax spinifera, Strain CCMP409" /LENGTH=131 /DNA_ID=CAMNT_0043534905 /DNA_START=651 /DNA_END=1043 /DNA_ORIENTATION=-
MHGSACLLGRGAPATSLSYLASDNRRHTLKDHSSEWSEFTLYLPCATSAGSGRAAGMPSPCCCEQQAYQDAVFDVSPSPMMSGPKGPSVQLAAEHGSTSAGQPLTKPELSCTVAGRAAKAEAVDIAPGRLA